jgi:FMN-dependent NADH-azoreductase|tara:strand:- start:3457 stop:4077 length:621 start_codon:yes stop_codon:yes gene_type:complete
VTSVFYINASPRGAASASTQAADNFLAALPNTATVKRLPLFESDLPEFAAVLASAKQKVMTGAALDDLEAAEWRQITALVDQFTAADHYLLAVPMWNFSIPYKLKHYIDLLTHPGLTFSRDANGVHGLASGSATVIYSRGGDYSPKDGLPDPFDFQSPYLRAWLTMVGLDPINEVLVQRTMAGPEGQADAVGAAQPQLVSLASALV